MTEKLLLERVTAAAEERHLSQNTLTAYRRTWIKAIAWAAAEFSFTGHQIIPRFNKFARCAASQ